MKEIYFYATTIGWLFLTGMGIVPCVPEEVAVSGVGIAAHKAGLVGPWMVIAWACCIVAIIGTDVVLYSLGRFGGVWFFNLRWVRYWLPEERKAKIVDGFHNHGIKFLLSGRLLPGIRTAIFIVAGAIHYPIASFIIADAISIPVISLFFFGSYFASDFISALIKQMHGAQFWLMVIGLSALGVFLIIRFYQFIRRRAKANNFEAPHIPGLHALGLDTHHDFPETPAAAENGEPKPPEAAAVRAEATSPSTASPS